MFCSVFLTTGLAVSSAKAEALPTINENTDVAVTIHKLNPNTPVNMLWFKEEENMELEQFSGTNVPSESPSTISLLTIYEESARASKLPRNDGSLSLSWGYNVDTPDGVSAEPVRGSETKERLATEPMETKQLSGSDKINEPRGAVKDQYGNLTSFKIGPENEEAQVTVSYEDPGAKPPTVQNTTVKRADGELIEYAREKDPGDPNSPFIYTETRNGSRGDLLYGSFNVASNGRMTLYFDFEKKRPAITFDPKTGYEEYP